MQQQCYEKCMNLFSRQDAEVFPLLFSSEGMKMTFKKKKLLPSKSPADPNDIVLLEMNLCLQHTLTLKYVLHLSLVSKYLFCLQASL